MAASTLDREMFHFKHTFFKEATTMTNTQQAEKRLAEYDARYNQLVGQRESAQTAIQKESREAKRLEVLLELGEATPEQLAEVRERISEAGERLEAVLAELQTPEAARAELETRLEAAQKVDQQEAKRQGLRDYREAAQELRALLLRAREARERMQAAGPGLWREGFTGLNKAGKAAVEHLPGLLEQDIRLVGQRLGDNETQD